LNISNNSNTTLDSFPNSKIPFPSSASITGTITKEAGDYFSHRSQTHSPQQTPSSASHVLDGSPANMPLPPPPERLLTPPLMSNADKSAQEPSPPNSLSASSAASPDIQSRRLVASSRGGLSSSLSPAPIITRSASESAYGRSLYGPKTAGPQSYTDRENLFQSITQGARSKTPPPAQLVDNEDMRTKTYVTYEKLRSITENGIQSINLDDHTSSLSHTLNQSQLNQTPLTPSTSTSNVAISSASVIAPDTATAPSAITTATSVLAIPSPTTPLPTTSNPHRYIPISTGFMKVKTHYGNDIFIIAVSTSTTFADLYSKVERKIRLGNEGKDGVLSMTSSPCPLKIRYKDEDGDFITINTDEDILMAFEASRMAAIASGKDRGVINLYVTSSK